jgi:hypothetical protein
MRPVSDHRSNPKEQIEHAVDVPGQSAQRKSAFEAIYKGKRAIKTVPEIAEATGLTTKRILNIGKRFADTDLVTQVKVGKNTAYQKDSFFASQKTKILGYVANPKKLEKLATKSRPHITVSQKITHIAVPTGLVKCKHITVDEIDSFAADEFRWKTCRGRYQLQRAA